MSPRKQLRASSEPVARAVSRLWIQFGLQVRKARTSRRWTVSELASRAGLSAGFVYRVEAGQSGSAEAAARIASALGRQAQLELIDPRRRGDGRPNLSADPVHSAMGELEAAHLRPFGFGLGLDEPYQHYQFAGRADLVAWDIPSAALLHIENRTRFPDFQDMAGAFNSKRAYLGQALAPRLGVEHWRSETHVIAALWTSEVLHALRLRTESFRTLCPDDASTFYAWWTGAPHTNNGRTSCLVIIDPLANPRQRQWISLEEALAARPRHRGYADVAQLIAAVTSAA